MRRTPGVRVGMAMSAVGLMLLALIGYKSLAQGQAEESDSFGEAPAFALVDQLERAVSSYELRGRVTVANFIYTNCTDACPLLTYRMQTLQQRLTDERLFDGRVQLLSFTVDPVRDTPAVLREYAERFQANPDLWRFLTGPKEDVVPLVVDGFKLGVTALPPVESDEGSSDDTGMSHQKPYEVMHGTRFVLIDPQGRIRAYYEGRDLDLDRVVGDIRRLRR